MRILDLIKNSMMDRVLRRLKKSGYSAYTAPIVLKNRYEDLFKNNKTSLREKLWAQKRGFTSDRIKYYGLTEENYQDYLSDFDYLWLHPINGPYSKWIDDKLSIKYILQPFSMYLPEYYYQIGNKEILKLMDCQGSLQQTIRDIIGLLKEKHRLAAKLKSSSGGKGFYKLAFDGEQFFINDQATSASGVEELILGWVNNGQDEYIITEYIEAHQHLREIWDKAPGSLRILVIREDNQSPKIISTSLRIGTNTSGNVDNVQAGAVLCIVEPVTGYYSKGIIRKGDTDIESKYHPDTKVLLEGTLPNWDIVKDGLIKICSYIPQVRYMGFDVIITNSGFKIIEINSLSGMSYLQYNMPFLKNESSRQFFLSLLNEKKARYKH